MRDNYAGDIGDFANCGLLRVLCGQPGQPVRGIRLGIIWCRNQADDGLGNHIGYLKPSGSNDQTYAACDGGLYAPLQDLVGQNMINHQPLTVPDIRNLPIFPGGTLHYVEPLPNPPSLQNRQQWFCGALQCVADANVVFLNPDTGMAWNDEWSHQYVYSREVQALLEMDKVIVIYQHHQRTDWVAENARQLLGLPLNVQYLRVLRWNTLSVRGYFIATRNENLLQTIDQRLLDLANSPWVANGHFTPQLLATQFHAG